ncbi:dipeptidase [Thalassoglobus polymorphus]|uniref:Membrane dipeptidase (Peptidase family M19) n=1 Tax=Thalassoglobus polymorphus TaxID=2527994 RepID=A0A517QP95_9PLAN|nr:membrane dipeptidase [Thalassoglobus polymorphus]QDT33441.1 Membrane dipeptidase (Peptidase family M19) [Thalassoglobus polymorphus]
MLIFDAHLDLAWNAVEWNRDLELTVAELRDFENNFEGIIPGACTVSYPELERGGIGIVIATLLPRLHRKHKELTFYQGRESSYAAAHGQLAYYRSMERKGVLKSLPDRAALAEHAQLWRDYLASPTGEAPPIGYILSMEGAPPILEPAQAGEWFDAGLRIVGPGHYGPNEYCHGTGSEGPLTDDGVQLLKEMDSVGLLLDATHLADESFWQALDVFNGPVLASHHNCRSLVPGDRQLDDDQIKALIERGSVIGAAFDNWMIKPGYVKKVTSADLVKIEDVVDHIDHVCQLAGNANHSGIGTDLDGGFGKEQCPGDLDTIADLVKIPNILESRGYSSEDIEKIMSKNFVDFFEKNLPEAN